MATSFIEPGGDADAGIGLWDTPVQGAPTVAADFVHDSHIKSIKYATGSANSLYKGGVLADSGGRWSIYHYFNALPTATASIVDALVAGPGSAVIVLRMESGGHLHVESAGVQLGSSGTATFVTGTWYRISVAYVVTSTASFTIQVYVNGVLDISISSSGTLSATGTADIFVGNISGDALLDMRTSDHYIDKNSSLSDPGNIWVTAKRPFANGTTNNFATNGTGSGYGSGNAAFINRRPPISGTDFVSVTPTTAKIEEYSIEGTSVGDINISSATIVDYMGWIEANVASVSNTPVMQIIVGGTPTTKTMTTAFAFYSQVKGSTTYPAGNTDIGMSAQYTTTGHLVKMAAAGVVVAYIPGVVTSPAAALGFFAMAG